MWELDCEEGWAPRNWCFWTVVLEKTLESPLDSKEIQPVLGVHWKDWCWSWNSNTLATSCEELTHWKRPWCWEGLEAGGKGDDRGWDGWMTSPTQWIWVWVNSRNWWWTGRHGVLRSMGSQRVRHDWATELYWTELSYVLLVDCRSPSNCNFEVYFSSRGKLHDFSRCLGLEDSSWENSLSGYNV